MTLTDARPAPLRIGPLTVDAPVVLAPMAGVTNMAFRLLCREYGAGLYVTEMVTSRALVERNPSTMRLIGHHESESIRSVQLYGTDPATVAEAIRILRDEDRADHVDLNFGCPVPKVTRKGGGAALPWKIDLFDAIVRAAVSAAGSIPVTVKMRIGIDDDHPTFRDAGARARDAGVAAVALHARTASQFYSGHAHWDAIAALKQEIPDIPILGNGDIWTAADAARMMRETGCDGVVVGRGCLGRPWLFAELARELAGIDVPAPVATLGFVADAFARHVDLLTEFFGDEEHACRDARKHVAWYFKGYPVGAATRSALATASSRAAIAQALDTLDPHAPYPGSAAEGPRGRAGTARRPALPDGWLASRDVPAEADAMLREAERDSSGG
jgi:nifR3 family TIM-barrel protein